MVEVKTQPIRLPQDMDDKYSVEARNKYSTLIRRKKNENYGVYK